MEPCVPLRGYPTFAAAVAAVPEARCASAQAATTALQGRVIEDHAYGVGNLILSLSGSSYLEWSVSKNGVTWSWGHGTKHAPRLDAHEELHLRFSADLQYTWTWKRWLDALVGREFVAVDAGETMGWLRTEGGFDLSFSALRDVDARRAFLFFCED